MAAKPEEVATAPADAVPASVEKPAEPAPAATEVEKPKPEEPTSAPTEALENLNISEKKTEDATATATATATPDKPAATSTEPIWPETPADHPLTKFFSAITDIVKEAGHDEVYGVKLDTTSGHFHTKLILQKFLRANQGDLEKAKQQLLETLKWRKEFDPMKAAGETFEKERFDGLGFVLEVEGVPGSLNEKDVVTFNVYGAVKDNQKTFGDLDG